MSAGEIVFSRAGSLFRIAPNGSHPRLLVRDAADAAVSPEGRWIAFVRNSSIWLMDRSGANQRDLTEPGRKASDYAPSWSPDGKAIYFSRLLDSSDTSSILTIRADGSHLRQLTRATPTDHGHCQDGTAPSPNGNVIVFVESFDCDHGSDAFLAAITLTGQRAKLGVRIEQAAGIDFDPAWAPGGSLLAYAALDTGAWPEYRVGASGIYVSSATARPLRVAAAADARGPAWSPDSRWIAFTRAADPNTHIWLVQSDGTGLRQVTRGNDADSAPAWLPPAR